MTHQYYGNLDFSDDSPLTFSSYSPLSWGIIAKIMSIGNKVRVSITSKFARG